MRIELRGVHAAYGTVPVLRDIDLVVPEGAIVALLGANGAGKSTVLRVAAGLMAPSQGSLLVDDVECADTSANRLARRGVCLVPGDRGVFRGLTVRQNIALQAEPGCEDEAVERTVDRFPLLGQRIDQLAGRLSGGEQQMLALARAHGPTTRCALLDEVSMGLAPKVVEEIFRSLRGLADSGRSLLLVEQYATKALALADIVYVLHQGRVAFAGQPAELNGEDLLSQYLGTPS